MFSFVGVAWSVVVVSIKTILAPRFAKCGPYRILFVVAVFAVASVVVKSLSYKWHTTTQNIVLKR
jgi:hypothetical protein